MLGAVTFFAREPSSPADAHALLVRAEPPANSQLRMPPTELTLYFSEPLERRYSSVRVTDQNGNRVETAVEFDDTDKALMRVSLPELSPGYITVDWATVSSVDGHRITGAYPITILNQDGSIAAQPPAGSSSSVAGDEANPGRVIAKAIILIAASLVAGVLAFLALVTPAASEDVRSAFERRLVRRPCWCVCRARDRRCRRSAVAGVHHQRQHPGHHRHAVGRTLALASPRADPARDCCIPIIWTQPRLRQPLAFGGSPGSPRYFGIASSASHAAAGGGAFWAAGSDFVHLLAASIWIGMLAVLAAVLRLGPTASLPARHATRHKRMALRRFSLLAVISVALTPVHWCDQRCHRDWHVRRPVQHWIR